MTYGYIRVSTDTQTVDNQRYEIERFAQKESLVVDDWIEETISGAKMYSKRALGKLLKKAQKGDLIIAVNGEDMTDSSVLLDRIDSGNVGDILTLTIARINSRTYKVTTFDVQIALVEDKGSN